MTDTLISNELRRKYRDGNMTFFLGAGISMNNGLPSWRELVTTMYFKYMAAESWGNLRPFSNYLYVASRHYMDKMKESTDIVIRKLKTGWTEQEYSESLWDSLYSMRQMAPGYNIDSLPGHITNVVKNDPRKIRSVITYNFDDILEEAFEQKGFNNYCVIYDRVTQQEPNKLPVFHVHGYVPFNDNPEKKIFGRLIFSEDDYNNLFNNPNNWANFVQINSLSSSTNLMIGLSLNDRNLRRILDITSSQPFRSQTYIFLKKAQPVHFTPEEIVLIDQQAQDLLTKWQGGGGTKGPNQYARQIEQILNGVFKNDTYSSTRVLEMFKITPIWVEDYGDIELYLNEMIG